jgi:hypothetical protein
MTTIRQARPDTTGPGAGAAGVRVIRATGRDEADPPEPWELPASAEDLRELATKRFERLPHRPASLAEVPAGAIGDLRAVVGEVGPEQLFVIPRAARTIGLDDAAWVVSPTEVVAVGHDRVAVWIDDAGGPRVREVLAIADVVGLLDRSILLYGRLQLIGPESSIVVRYNTVGQPELRSMLLPVRRAALPVETAVPEGGRDPGELPHKWMALLRSKDVLPRGLDRLLVAAGDLGHPRPQLHNGVAVLSSAELVVATDPTPDVHMAQYGVDLLAVARRRLLAIAGEGATLRVTVATGGGPVEIRVVAHPTLVKEATTLLAPVAGAAAG